MRYKEIRLTSTHVPTIVQELQSALRESVILKIINGLPEDQFPKNPLTFWESVANSIGSFERISEDSKSGTQIHEFQWMDVRYDPQYGSTFRHHNSAQPLHSDGAYTTDVRDTAIFYCEKQAPAGGATIFIDVMDLVDVLKTEDKAFYEQLKTIPVHFSKLGQPGKLCPILNKDDSGYWINWNYFRVTPNQSKDVHTLCEKFHQYLQSRIVDQQKIMPIRLQAKDVVFFRDSRVLHGRHAYTAYEAGDRIIWKSYIALGSESKLHAKT